jgi:hypothetical protein
VDGRFEGCVEGLAVALLFLELFTLLLVLELSTLMFTLLVTFRVGALILVGAR